MPLRPTLPLLGTPSRFKPRQRVAALLLLAALVVTAGCNSEARLAEETAEWQAWRHLDIQQEDSWLTLIDYHYVTEAGVALGTDAGEGAIVLPRGPATAGRFYYEGNVLMFESTGRVAADGEHLRGPIPALREDGSGARQ